MRPLILLLIILPLSGWSQNKHYKKALAKYEVGKFDQALAHLDRINDQQGDDVKLLRAKVLYINGQYLQIQGLLEGIKNLDDDGRLALATSYYDTEQYEKSRDLWKTLLEDDDDDKATIYCNLSATFYHMADVDSAIYYTQRALELEPYNALFIFNLGVAYSSNEEGAKACAHYFLADKLGNPDGANFSEDENCPSWKEQWLRQIPGQHVTQLSNIFPNNNEPVLSINENYIFEEAGGKKQVELLDMNRSPAGVVFKLATENGEIIYRWFEFDKQYDWTLKHLAAVSSKL